MTLGDIAEAVKNQLIEKNQQEAERSAQEQRYAELKEQQIRDQKAYEQKLKDAEKSRAGQERERERAEQEKRKRHEQFNKDRTAVRAERQQRIKETEENIKAEQKAESIRQETAKYKEMAARNEARKAKDAADEAILKDRQHTANQRIEARRRIEERKREDVASRTPRPQKEYTIKGFGGVEHKIKMDTKGGITPETIKESIKKTVSKTPAKLDSIATGVFGGMLDATTKPKPQYNAKWYKQEQKQMSTAVKMHERKPVTGGKVRPVLQTMTPVVKSNAIFVKPGYVESLLGSTPATKKTKGVFNGLDDFVRRL